MTIRRTAATAICVALLAAGCSSSAKSSGTGSTTSDPGGSGATTALPTKPSPTVRAATVSGPVDGGTPAKAMFSTRFDVSEVGYQEREFFLTGKASSYTSANALTPDGKWTAQPGTTAPYTTRVVVRRPAD